MKTFLLAASLLCPLLSYACSFAPRYEKFTPAVAAFEARMAGEPVALLPPPRVGSIRVYRGTASPGSSCDDAGSLVLELNWPKSTGYRLQDIGFYFRVVGGQQPDRIFPLEPVTGTIAGRNVRFAFYWLDGHPSGQIPLKLDVEVFAVNKGLQIGAPWRFRIDEHIHKAPGDAKDLLESLLDSEYRTARAKIIAAGWRPEHRRAALEWTRLLQKWYPELHDCASDRPVCSMFFKRERGACLRVIVGGDVPALYRVVQIARECDNAGEKTA